MAALIVLSFASTELQISFPFDCIKIDRRKIKIPKPTLETHRKADPGSGEGVPNQLLEHRFKPSPSGRTLSFGCFAYFILYILQVHLFDDPPRRAKDPSSELLCTVSMFMVVRSHFGIYDIFWLVLLPCTIPSLLRQHNIIFGLMPFVVGSLGLHHPLLVVWTHYFYCTLLRKYCAVLYFTVFTYL